MNAHEGAEQATLTLGVMQQLNLPWVEVWVHYMGSGGGVDEFEFNAYLHRLLHLPALERDTIAHAVNELCDDLCRTQQAPYSAAFFPTKPLEP